MRVINPAYAPLRPHQVWWWVGGVFSVLYILVTPPYQGSDEHTHLCRVYQLTEGQLLGEKRWVAGQPVAGGELPVSLLRTKRALSDSVAFNPTKHVSVDSIAAALQYPLAPERRAMLSFPNTVLYSPVVYAPQLPVVWLGRQLRLSPLVLLYLGRVACALLSLWLVGLALRRLPWARWAMLFVVLLPMGFFQGVIFSADAVNHGVAMLFLATVLQTATGGGLITRRRKAELFALALALALAKTAYVPLLLLGLLIPLRRWGKGAVVQLLFFGGVPLLLAAGWGMLNTDRYLSVRPGENVHLEDQLAFLREHTGYFPEVLARSAIDQTGKAKILWMAALGMSEVYFPRVFYSVYDKLLLLLFLFGARRVSLQWLTPGRRLALAGTAFLTWAVMLLFIYLSFSQVGEPYIHGNLGRYYIPIVPVLLLALPLPFSYRLPEALRRWGRAIAIGLPALILLAGLFALLFRFYGGRELYNTF